MKRRDWLTLALIGCTGPLSTLHAQDTPPAPRIPLPGKTQDTVKQVEPGNKSSSGKEGAVADSESASPSAAKSGEYVPSFSDRMADFSEVMFRPVSGTWFTDLFGANVSFLPGDVEDPSWFKMEMLFAQFKNANIPPMLTTSRPQESRGILGNDGTTVLFGDSVDMQLRYGFRVTGGFWTEPSQQMGIEGSFFYLPARTVGVNVASNGSFLLAAPFYDVLANQQSSVPIANEALNNGDLDHLSGAVDIGITARMTGAELNVMQNLIRGTRGRLDWSWGYRYLRYDENLFNQVFTAEDPPMGQNFGTQRLTYDEFMTQNEFQGLNLSLRSQWWWGAWSLDLTGKIGLGVIRNTVQVYGSTLTASPPQFQIISSNGGIYALNSNIGDQTFLRFSAVPEIEVGLGYEFCEQWRFLLNYNFMAITNVMRAGDQVDSRINPNILDGNAGNPAVPVRLNQTSTFWMQTFSFGIEYRW